MSRLQTVRLLTSLQWSLAVIAFEAGLLQASGTDPRPAGSWVPGPGAWGWWQALLAVLVVVPSATGFVPRLAPADAAALAVAFGGASAGFGPLAGSWTPLLLALMALGFALVAVGRLAVVPVEPLALGPERTDPWHLPPGLVERRQSSAGRPVPPRAPAIQRLELAA